MSSEPEPPVLPEATAVAEEAFVAWWREEGQSLDALQCAIDEAMRQRRVALAGRLVGLLPEDRSDPLLERARRAASLVLHRGAEATASGWEELEASWRAVRPSRRERSRRRREEALTGREPRPGRSDRGRGRKR